MNEKTLISKCITSKESVLIVSLENPVKLTP